MRAEAARLAGGHGTCYVSGAENLQRVRPLDMDTWRGAAMNRFLLGAAIGAAMVYFLDDERGETRRMRASNWISQYVNSDTMEQARSATRSTVEQARTLKGQVTDQVSQLRSNRRSSSTAQTTIDAAEAAAKDTSQKTSASLKS